jgi:hypothetical protein
MTLFDDYKNMHKELINKKRTPELKKTLQKKYNKLFTLSEKLFDKIYEKDLTSDEINIVSTMIRMKLQRDNGDIEKLQADKNIGELLCKTYVEPMLKKKKSD